MGYIIKGGLLGALLITLLLFFGLWIFSPTTLRDGQVAVGFIFWELVGALLGATVASGLRPQHTLSPASRTFSLLGGACVASILGLAVLYLLVLVAVLISGAVGKPL